MIPSRPLTLVELIAETLTTARRIVPRYAILFLLLIVPGAFVVTVATQNIVEDGLTTFQHDLHYTDSSLTVVRDETRAWLHANNPMFEQEEKALGISDTIPPNIGYSHLHQVRSQLVVNGINSSDGVLLVSGIILLVLGSLTCLAATIDLASRHFEEQSLDLWDALRSALRHHLLRMFALYVLFWFIALFFEICFIAIASLPAGVSSFIGSMFTFFECYVALRLIAAVPSLVNEEIGPVRALRRTFYLTYRRALPILGKVFAFGLILLVFTIFVSIVANLFLSNSITWFVNLLSMRPLTFEWLRQSTPAVLWSLSGEMALFALLLGPLLIAFVTVLYYDLRTRRDGPLVYID